MENTIRAAPTTRVLPNSPKYIRVLITFPGIACKSTKIEDESTPDGVAESFRSEYIRETLMDCDLVELDKIVELWPKLEPLEKIMDRLSVFWGAVNHLNFVKDTSETPLRH
ncbi:hypothetical protein L2E82_10593 [Cichorium intybus]|uniref:Uncharacterized protein n=1 Tax=Cichorium intybus TaxID=13427 RepID=A0ACB9GAU3_CICIN|nr:hypothetical protein L2E82_10593 [Cichorium intybus]